MMEKLKDILNKYRFAVLVALAGVVLMLLPAGKQETEAADTAGVPWAGRSYAPPPTRQGRRCPSLWRRRSAVWRRCCPPWMAWVGCR